MLTWIWSFVIESIDEIDSFIMHSQSFLSGLHRSHPLRLTCIYRLATVRLDRYALSNQVEDLDKSIILLTESILLPSYSWLEHDPTILQALLLLASTLIKRSEISQQPQDSIAAAKCLRHLLYQPHGALGVPRHLVATMLVEVLAFQVELKVGDVIRSVGEMADLCRELLTSYASDDDATHTIILFAKAVRSKVRPWIPDQLLDQIIACLRLARMHKPDLPVVRFALAFSLGIRYCMTFMNDDYEEAASILDELITSNSPGDSRDGLVAEVQRMVTGLSVIRSKTHQTPEYSEESLYRARTFLISSPEEHSFNPLVNHSLED